VNTSARPRRRRQYVLVSAVAALVGLLAGCQAGDGAPTLTFHPPADSSTFDAGNIAIRNVFVLGAPLGSKLRPGQTASVFFSLVNNGTPDRLTGISAPGYATSAHLPAGGIAVTPGKPVYISGPQTVAYLTGLTRTITAGSNLTLNFFFKKEGEVSFQVPVFARALQYATFPAAPSPTPSVTGNSKTKASASPSVTPSPSAS
jgi:copper(I)-binding protein